MLQWCKEEWRGTFDSGLTQIQCGSPRTQLCAYAYATVLERGAAASIDIDAAVAAHHDEFAFPM